MCFKGGKKWEMNLHALHQIFHYLFMRHYGLSGTSYILEMHCCHSNEGSISACRDRGQKGGGLWSGADADWIRLLFSISPGEQNTFVLLWGCFFPVVCDCVQREPVSDPCSLCNPTRICCDTIWPGERLRFSPWGNLSFIWKGVYVSGFNITHVLKRQNKRIQLFIE